MSQYQQLILRSNRHLATALLDQRLINTEDVEKANAKLLSFLQSGKTRYASLLSILIYDQKALDENSLIRKLVDHHKVGLVHLGQFDMARAPMADVDVDDCWATMTVPFDRIGSAVCLATCYYLSKPAVDFWEQGHSKGLWYTTTLNSLTSALESLVQTQESGGT